MQIINNNNNNKLIKLREETNIEVCVFFCV